MRTADEPSRFHVLATSELGEDAGDGMNGDGSAGVEPVVVVDGLLLAVDRQGHTAKPASPYPAPFTPS